jgi:ATP-dependent RNA helicase DDX3X
MRPNSRLERELYKDIKLTGIDFDSYDDIPVDVSGENIPEGVENFETVQAATPSLFANMERTMYKKPTPVQKHSLPIGLLDRDLMACAQTGSGKTAGFLFPLISVMLRDGPMPVPEDGRSRRRKAYPNALILAPTRELAIQISKEAAKFTYLTGI